MSKGKTLLKKDQLISAYKDMLLSRKLEERCANEYRSGCIGGFCHLYTGQEAISAAIKYAKTKNDHLVTAYRCHAFALAFGEPVEAIFAELFGRKIGSSKGKGGSMHIFSPENNFWGGHGIVGAQVSLGTGIGFAAKYKNTGGIAIACMGDGAINQGQVYESFNMAGLMDLPVLYIVENNGYAMGTSTIRHSASGNDFSTRGMPFGIEGRRVDGMNFLHTYEVVHEMLNQIRKTSRPMLLQCDTYRYRGHSMSDPAKYREKEEVEEYKSRDPIKTLETSLLDDGLLKAADVENIDNELSDIIEKAYEVAINADYPDLSEIYTDVTV